MAQLRKLNAKNSLQARNQCAACKQTINDKLIRFREQNYHLDCFKCSQCAQSLQKATVYVDEGKMTCEPCYLKTLDKCCVCQQPITDEKAAIGERNYHRQCFRCAGRCGQVLGEMFYESNDGQFMCHQDYLETLLPTCSHCQQRIQAHSVSEEGHLVYHVNFLDKRFHPNCFLCDQCQRPLESLEPNSTDPSAQCRRLYYSADQRKLCLECYTQVMQPPPPQ